MMGDRKNNRYIVLGAVITVFPHLGEGLEILEMRDREAGGDNPGAVMHFNNQVVSVQESRARRESL